MLVLETNTKFFVKKPNKTRKTFGLVKYSPINRTEKIYLELSDSEQIFVLNINSLYKSNQINHSEAEIRFKKFISEHNIKNKLPENLIKESIISDYNRKIYSKFWIAKYEDKELVDISSARYDFERALKALETIAVDSDIKLIKRKLKDLKPSKMKRIFARLNEIRSYLGIADRLSTNKAEVESVSYITLTELNLILQYVEDCNIKLALITLFATGVRLSELLALGEQDFYGTYLFINKQLKANGNVYLPKRQKIGKVVIIKELVGQVVKFLKIKNKQELRSGIYNVLTTLSNKVLGRHIHPHDLRHSHAIYLLSKGASLTLISLQLRNRIEVCQKHYSGFEHTEDTIILLNRIIGS